MRPSRRGHAQQRYHAFIAWSADSSLGGRSRQRPVTLQYREGGHPLPQPRTIIEPMRLQVRRLMLCFPKSYYCDHRWHVALSLPTFGVGVLSQFSRPQEANTARARRGRRLGGLSDRGIDIAKTPHFALAFRMRCGCFRRRACRLLLRDRCSCK